jgi:hypothetical protein
MNDQDSLNAYRERRMQERSRVAKLVLVALVAGFVGAGWGYVKGEVAVLTGDSEVASVLLAVDPATQVAADASATVKVDTSKNGGSVTVSTSGDGAKTGDTATTKSNTKLDCTAGGEDQCRNKCTTTYLNVSSGGVQTKDCYGKGDDKAKPLILALRKCITENGGSFYAEDILKQKLCLVDKPQAKVEDASKPSTGQIINKSNAVDSTAQGLVDSKKAVDGISVPAACKDAYEKVIALRTAKMGDTMSGDGATNCTYNGSMVCYRTGAGASTAVSTGTAGARINGQDGYEKDANRFVCKTKEQFAKDNTTSGPADPSSAAPDCSKLSGFEKIGCTVQKGFDDLRKSLSQNNNSPTNGVTGGGSPLGNALGRALGQGLTGQSGSGSNNQQQPQCPAGYTLSNQQPQTSSSTGSTTGYDQYGAYTQPVVYTNNTYVCVPSNQANAQPPQCTFNVSKKNPIKGEKVTLTWSTSNTDNGGKVMLSDGTNSGKIETSGTQDVTINSARTYTLTAYNAKGETKQCTVEITLGGTGEEGTSGAYPPKLSCAPSIIEAGKSATVTWECPTAAKKSAGEGATTGGAVKGQKTVTPTTNSEYTVSCFSSDTANIDDEESEDFLGKRTCSVRVAKPEFDLIAYPEHAKRGERVRISWGSLFMKTCKVTGPRGFDYTRPNGVVVTEPFSTNDQTAPDRTIRAAVYTITCESLFGKTYSADAEVDFQI